MLVKQGKGKFFTLDNGHKHMANIIHSSTYLLLLHSTQRFAVQGFNYYLWQKQIENIGRST